MLRHLGRYLGNNLLGLLALVVAASGTAYAVATIGTAEIVDDSVRSIDIKNSNITGTDLLDESVTSVDLKNGTVRAGDLAATPWTNVAATAGAFNCAVPVGTFCTDVTGAAWRNYEGGFQVARYRKTLSGEVFLEGMVQEFGNGAGASTRMIFVLPEGLRPAATHLIAVACGAPVIDKHGVLEVHPTGAVIFRGSYSTCDATNYVSLSGVTFAAG